MSKKDILKTIKYMLRFLPDKIYLQLYYFASNKKFMNLKKPQTFNEKLQWLKLYDRNPEYTKMVDKYEAKKYVASKIGEEYIIPTLGVYDKFDDIDFSKLPNQFVIKCTHDSGGLVICKDKTKLDIKAARKKINKCLKNNYYWLGREWPYKNVKPRIIIEKYITDESKNDLKDYKIFCFHGKPEMILVCSERFILNNMHKTFFDTNWNQLNLTEGNHITNKKIKKPKHLNLMLKLATKLSENIPFIRVDFYEINNKVYFGELTFYPNGGFEKFEPKYWDYKLGRMINLK